MATSIISNTITNPSGTAVASVAVRATLMPCAGFRADATEVARVVTTTSNGSGAWTLTLERNSNITPANTWYLIEEAIPVASGGARSYAIQVGASNQSVSAALVSPLPTPSVAGYLTQSAADARYQALSAIGTDTPTTIDPDDAASAGASTAASRGDHQHAITTGTPVATGDANAEGAGTGFARDTHVHKGVVANDAWTAYTPVVGGGWTQGNGTVSGAYVRLGRTVYFRAQFTVGNGTIGNTLTLTLPPVTAIAAQVGHHVPAHGFDASTSDNYGLWAQFTSTTVVSVGTPTGATTNDGFITSASPLVWAASDVFYVQGFYEAAS